MATPRPYARPLKAAIETALSDTPVVCLLGARQAGKTTLARQFEPGYGYISLDESDALAFAESDPVGFVNALPERAIIDEVQRVPELLRTIKLSVDRKRRPGRFLLTGSANLLTLPRLGDSLAGRMEVIDLQPLSAAEQARKPGSFLRALLDNKLKTALSLGEGSGSSLVDQVVRGGFPEAVRRPAGRARIWHRQYLRSLIERDIRDVARVQDPQELARLLEILSLRTARLLNITTLANELGLNRRTVERYFAICERLFLVRRLSPWNSNRAKRLIRTPKVHFVDTGLASALSGFAVADAIARRTHYGHLLESFVVQQLIAQAGWSAPELEFSHYRDKDQVEVDLVLNRGRDVWGVEVKASATASPSDGQGLRRLASQCGKAFRGGAVLYAGSATMKLGIENCFAVPLARLWEM